MPFDGKPSCSSRELAPGIQRGSQGERSAGLQRVTELTAPPVVGRWYLVPTVRFGYLSEFARDWPVFLPKHEDARFFAFDDQHYHVDPRFLAKSLMALLGCDIEDSLQQSQRAPLAKTLYGRWSVAELPAPVWRRRLCQLPEAVYQFGHNERVNKLRDHFAGQHCKSNRHGWVCPHQNWPMGSLAPDEEGVLTCPLHGLRVRASDGLVLPNPAHAIAALARSAAVELEGAA